MRFLRALLNSGVFMIILLAAATLYLVYSDEIKREHGIDVVSETQNSVAGAVASVAETMAAPVVETVAPVVSLTNETPIANTAVPLVQEEAVVSPNLVIEQAIEAEPAFETQPPRADELVPLSEQNQMVMPSMMPYLPPMEMPAMPAMEPMPVMPAMEPMPAMPAMEPMPAMPAMEPMPAMPAMEPMPAMPAMEAVPVVSSNIEKARAALFEGNLDVAKEMYQAELVNTNNPDLHGELGNVYFAQQNWQDAAIEYAAAIEGLSAQGRFLQAQYVLGFLMQIDPDMGKKIMMNLRTQMHPETKS